MKFYSFLIPVLGILVSFTPLEAKETKIEIRGRQLLVDDAPFVMKAVCYNPVEKGGTHPSGLIFKNPSPENLEELDNDFRLMREAGINTLRTYEPILDPKVLALVEKHDLYMIVPAFNWFDTSLRRVIEVVTALKDNQRVLIWEIGNEWNYNAFYSSPRVSDKTSRDMIRAAGSVIKTFDKKHPIATVYGEIPSKEIMAELSDIDIWGINVYSGISFGKRFESWKALSNKPMYLGEFGADAYNALLKAPDTDSQAVATAALIKEINANLSANDPKNAAIGASIFEWNDEWWKDEKGTASTQEPGGIAPGGGPYPDATFNEEWWGLVDIDRNVRPAYLEVKALWGTPETKLPELSTPTKN